MKKYMILVLLALISVAMPEMSSASVAVARVEAAVTVAPIAAEDCFEMACLNNDLINNHYTPLMRALLADEPHLTPEFYTEKLPAYYELYVGSPLKNHYVAKINREVAGYIEFYPLIMHGESNSDVAFVWHQAFVARRALTSDEYTVLAPYIDPTVMYVDDLEVGRHAQRRGVGVALLAAMVGEIKKRYPEVKSVLLAALKNNPALHFYHSMGFQGRTVFRSELEEEAAEEVRLVGEIILEVPLETLCERIALYQSKHLK